MIFTEMPVSEPLVEIAREDDVFHEFNDVMKSSHGRQLTAVARCEKFFLFEIMV